MVIQIKVQPTEAEIKICEQLQISQESWRELKQKMYSKTVKAKQTLLQEGEICRNLIFVKKGAIRSYYTEDGKEFVDQFFFGGSVVANFQSFLGQLPSETSIEAIEDTEVLVLPYYELEALQQRNVFRDLYLKISLSVMKLMKTRFYVFLAKSPVQRYVELQQKQPEILYRVPQYMIASYLGITPETLSRIRKRLATRKRSISIAA